MLTLKHSLLPHRLFLTTKPQFSKSLNLLPYYFFSSKSPYLTTKRFSDLPLAPQLKDLLQQNGLEFLTSIQSLSLPFILEGKNALIQSEASSGKTLCYILPILNYILSGQSVDPTRPNLKGALVLAPTKELCVQIYSFFRMFDPNNQLRLTRLGSMIFFTAVVPFLDLNNTDQDLRDISFQNAVNTVTWSDLDILITTPLQLEDIIKAKDKVNPYDLNPKFIVLDEYDTLLGEENQAKATRSLLRRFAGMHKSIFGEINAERQFIVCGSTTARKTENTTVEDELRNTFKDLEVLQSEGFQKVGENIKYEHVTLKKEGSVEEELEIVKGLIEKSPARKIIVFCHSPERIRHVYGFLQNNGIESLYLHSNLSLEERNRTIVRFKFSDDRILIATDLGSRGIDFKGVEHVIQFDFGVNAAAVLHRIGRTGRCGSSGAVTSLVREKDEVLAEKLKAMVENKESLNVASVASKSAKKKEKRKYLGQEEEGEEK